MRLCGFRSRQFGRNATHRGPVHEKSVQSAHTTGTQFDRLGQRQLWHGDDSTHQCGEQVFLSRAEHRPVQCGAAGAPLNHKDHFPNHINRYRGRVRGASGFLLDGGSSIWGTRDELPPVKSRGKAPVRGLGRCPPEAEAHTVFCAWKIGPHWLLIAFQHETNQLEEGVSPIKNVLNGLMKSNKVTFMVAGGSKLQDHPGQLRPWDGFGLTMCTKMPKNKQGMKIGFFSGIQLFLSPVRSRRAAYVKWISCSPC